MLFLMAFAFLMCVVLASLCWFRACCCAEAAARFTALAVGAQSAARNTGSCLLFDLAMSDLAQSPSTSRQQSIDTDADVTLSSEPSSASALSLSSSPADYGQYNHQHKTGGIQSG